LPASGTGPPLILAVSDGHGSAKYFRSHVGAERAVETAAWVIQDLLDGQPDPTNLSAIKRTAEDRLPQEVVRRWKESVTEHFTQSPLTPDELGTLEQRDGAAARQTILDNPALAYGATVLAVLVAETFVLYLQLGDGDILVISEDGEVTRPMERDTRLFANQTTSLCSTDAWRDVQVRFQALVDPPPAVILLATDGYANSFVNETAFLQVGTDIWEMIRAEGLEAVQSGMATWLNEASQAGSGDDITLGILYRSDVGPQPGSEESAEPVLVVSGPQTGEIDPAAEVDELTWTLTLKRVPRSKK
jgi:serine/threonine protein phosphatase PrpC